MHVCCCALYPDVQVGPPRQGQPREQLSFQQPGPSQCLSSAIQNTSGISPQPFLPLRPSCTPPNPVRNLHPHEQPTVCLLPEMLPLLLPCSLVSAVCTLPLTWEALCFPEFLPGSLEASGERFLHFGLLPHWVPCTCCAALRLNRAPEV